MKSRKVYVEHCSKVKWVKVHVEQVYETKVRESACRTLFESKV